MDAVWRRKGGKEGRREGGQESWSVGWWIDKAGGVKKAGRNEDERK